MRGSLWGLLLATACAQTAEPGGQGDETEGDVFAEELADEMAGEDDASFDHGYDAIRPLVAIDWDLDAGLDAVLTNPGDAPVQVELTILARAASAQDVVGDVGTFVVDPGESIEVSLDADQLPAQSQHAPTEITLVARVHRDDAAAVDIHSTPVRVTFDDGWDLADVEVASPPGDVEQALLERSRMLAGTGRFLAPDGTSTPIEADDELTTAPAANPWFPPFPPIWLSTVVCPTWRTHYDDPNPGQDYLAASGTQHVPASYAFITIATPTVFFPYYTPGQLVWEGYLDEAGCAPALSLDGTYVFSLHTKHRKGALDIETRYNTTTNSFGYASGSFSANTSGGLRTPTTGDDNRATRVATLVSRALVTEDLPIRALSTPLQIFAHQNCPGSGNYAACYNGRLFIGNNNYGQDMSLRRHVVAHEFGHGVQARAIGWLAIDYFNGDAPTSQPLCRCDHVMSSNQAHCLQSRETLTTAFTEGFAHFVAVKLFNDPEQSSCRFSYYKEFLSTSGTVLAPPVNINCGGAYRWMESRGCAAPDRGTEYDWMNFLWTVNKTSTLALDELWDVLRDSCGGGCGSQTISWPNIQAAVLASPDLTTSQKNSFAFAAAAFGVDH